MKAYVLIGNIASGKSTWAKAKGLPVVSRDAIRYELGNGEYLFNRKVEEFITIICNIYISSFLLLEKDVVIDGTNMTVESRTGVIMLLKSQGCEVIAVVFPDRGCADHVRDRMADNHGDTSKEKWETIFWNFKLKYQSPKEEEGFSKIIYTLDAKCDNCHGHGCHVCSGTGVIE